VEPDSEAAVAAAAAMEVAVEKGPSIIYYEVGADNQSDGVSQAELVELVESGDVSDHTRVWCRELEEWTPLGECKFLFPALDGASIASSSYLLRSASIKSNYCAPNRGRLHLPQLQNPLLRSRRGNTVGMSDHRQLPRQQRLPQQ
jgi:hypothetical protein